MNRDMLKPVDDMAAHGAEADDDSSRPGIWERLKTLLGLKPKKPDPAACLQELLPAETLEKNGAQLAEDRKSLQMLGRLVAFSGQTVEDVLVPRSDIVAVPAEAPLAEVLEVFTEALHSRLPVYDETLDDIIGMVHIKDLLRHLKQHAQPRTGGDAVATLPDMILPGAVLATPVGNSPLLRPVLYVPDSMPAADLLLKMQTTRIHLAIVIDEYGGTEGIATIEDVIEEIVGEIDDEHDANEEGQTLVTVPGGFVASARLEVQELERRVGIDLLPDDLDEEVDTLGGLLFTQLGRVPVRGEVVKHKSGIEFEILEADPRRIKKVKVLLPRHLRDRLAGLSGDAPPTSTP